MEVGTETLPVVPRSTNERPTHAYRMALNRKTHLYRMLWARRIRRTLQSIKPPIQLTLRLCEWNGSHYIRGDLSLYAFTGSADFAA